MGNSKQVAPPGEKPARRWAIPPALGGSISSFLSFVKRPVRTRMRGVVGAGEGDLPGYPIRQHLTYLTFYPCSGQISPQHS